MGLPVWKLEVRFTPGVLDHLYELPAQPSVPRRAVLKSWTMAVLVYELTEIDNWGVAKRGGEGGVGKCSVLMPSADDDVDCCVVANMGVNRLISESSPLPRQCSRWRFPLFPC
jgi:hypothetical protein